MDGYSVEQAAEVLGIPQGRVWELIARGVLAGATEGGTSMRVYLKPAGTPSTAEGGSSSAANGERHRTNGDSNGELSPFRELLTEFRNLTERYGQALLALGEARGEVAALRGRVDLLEARMEMRLPMRPASTVAWEMPGYPPAPAAQPDAVSQHAPPAPDEAEPPAPAAEAAIPEGGPPPNLAAPTEPVTPADEDEQTTSSMESSAPEAAPSHPDTGRRRVSGGHAAVAGLAEALARAEDPALVDLPGAREAAEAFAALRRRDEASTQAAAAEEDAGDLRLDEEMPAEMFASEADALAAYAPTIELADEEEPAASAEPASDETTTGAAEDLAATEPPAAEAETMDENQPAAYVYPPDSPYTTEVVEPDWFADGDFAWPEGSEADGADEPSVSQPEGMGEGQDMAEPDAEAEHLEAERELPAATAIQDAFEEPERPLPSREAESAADEAEAQHLEGEQELPAAGAIQDAFEEPEAEPADAEAEAQHLEGEQELPAAGAIQDAFDEPDAPDVPSGEPTAGFGLFRGQPEPAPPTDAPGVEPPRAARDEEAVMWLGDEFEAAGLEIATPGWHSGEAAPEEEAPALQLSEAEIEQLAATEGWDRAEIDAIRDLVGRPAEGPAEPSPPSESPPEADRPAQDQSVAEHGGGRFLAGNASTPHVWPKPRQSPAERIPWIAPDAGEPVDPDWLRGRRGPAADAYRRLRRLFQG